MKSGVFEQPLVFSRRTEKVIADRAAGRNLLMREKAANYQGIAVQQTSARLQHSVDFRQGRRPSRNVAKHVVRKDRVNAANFKRQRARNIALLELCNGRQPSLTGELIGVPNPMRVAIQTSDSASNLLGQTQCIPA